MNRGNIQTITMGQIQCNTVVMCLLYILLPVANSEIQYERKTEALRHKVKKGGVGELKIKMSSNNI